MDTNALLIQLFTVLTYTLPQLIACIVGIVLLWRSSNLGPARSRGLLGIGLITFAFVSHFAIGAGQALIITWAVHSAQTTSWQMGVLGIVGLLVNCVLAAGLIVLVLALCRALRDARSAAPAPP